MYLHSHPVPEIAEDTAPGLAEGGNRGVVEEGPPQVAGRTQVAGTAVGDCQHNGDQTLGEGG